MRGRHYKKWYSRDNMPEGANHVRILLHSEDSDAFEMCFLEDLLEDETRRFVIAHEYGAIPEEHPYFVLKVVEWDRVWETTEMLKAAFGPVASCYDDFVADHSMGYFIGRDYLDCYCFIFRTEEDRTLATLMMPHHERLGLS